MQNAPDHVDGVVRQDLDVALVVVVVEGEEAGHGALVAHHARLYAQRGVHEVLLLVLDLGRRLEVLQADGAQREVRVVVAGIAGGIVLL